MCELLAMCVPLGKLINGFAQVNTMAANLTGQVRAIAEVTTAVARGDLSKKIDVDVKGTRSQSLAYPTRSLVIAYKYT